MRRTLILVTTTLVVLGIPRHADVGGTPLPRSLPAQEPMAIPSRNMVNLVERDLPTSWSVEENKFKNIKWSVDLDQTYGAPVVAHGKVFAATTDEQPVETGKIRKAVLKAFRESDGKFLWQITHDSPFQHFPRCPGGLVSAPTIDGPSLFYVTHACEVVCADSIDGKVTWRYDMMKELNVVPFTEACIFLPLGSPLVVAGLVFVITGNGVDDSEKVASPLAPSFVALQKNTGKLVWQSNLPGDNIIQGQCSSPAFAVVNNIPQVIFGGGDGVIYAFEPETGKLIWKCKCNPAPKNLGRMKKGEFGIENYIVGTPVVLGNRLYVGLGHHPGGPQASRASHFLCLDITKRGDVSFKNYDATSPENKNSALVWAFGGLIEPRPEKGRRAHFGSTISTSAVHDGLVFISEEQGYLHCLDASTGKLYWVDDLKAPVWGSPYWVDGKVYLGTEDGAVRIYAHGKTRKLLATIEMDSEILTSPAAAHGVLFVTTKSKLYAIK